MGKMYALATSSQEVLPLHADYHVGTQQSDEPQEEREKQAAERCCTEAVDGAAALRDDNAKLRCRLEEMGTACCSAN